MTGTRAYVVRELEDTDEPAVLRLLQSSLAGGPTGERTAEFLRWKHHDNPFGRSPGLVAVDGDGQLAAVRLLMRWQLRAAGRTLSAVRAVDTATGPEHQGQGLFRRLTLQALDTVANDADLVFNTPNDQSRPGYLKMGWTQVGDVPVSLRPHRPVRVARALRGLGQHAVHDRPAPVTSRLPTAGAVLAEHADEVQVLLDEVEAHADHSRLRTPVDLGYLRWRYARPPGLDYRAVAVRDRGALRAVAFGRLRRRGTLTELTLGDVLVRPGDGHAARAVLRAAGRGGTDLTTTSLPNGSTAAAALLRAGYLTAPGRGLTLTTNPRRDLPVEATALHSWGLTLGDLELF